MRNRLDETDAAQKKIRAEILVLAAQADPPNLVGQARLRSAGARPGSHRHQIRAELFLDPQEMPSGEHVLAEIFGREWG